MKCILTILFHDMFNSKPKTCVSRDERRSTLGAGKNVGTLFEASEKCFGDRNTERSLSHDSSSWRNRPLGPGTDSPENTCQVTTPRPTRHPVKPKPPKIPSKQPTGTYLSLSHLGTCAKAKADRRWLNWPDRVLLF